MFAKIKPIAHKLKFKDVVKIKNVRQLNISSILCSDETENAKKATSIARNGPTVFDKIIDKEIPIKLLYEDEKCLAFNDIAPQAPIHFLVIPKRRIDMIENVTENDEKVSEFSKWFTFMTDIHCPLNSNSLNQFVDFLSEFSS